jgi:serine/threonine protein kinase
MRYIAVVLGTASALFFLGLAITLILFARKHKSCIGPTLAEKQYGRVSYHALSNGTNGFSEANLLGKGSFGAVYKCTFEDEGTIAAVKVFNPEQHGSARSFMVECEALRRVRHRCLIKIITCCSSINHQGQEFKALVFEVMPNGSLDDWLHPKFGMCTPNNTLNLAQRLDIAVDVMDALDYLHNHCHPPIIHCDIKPSNILLAEDMSARVGDFGLSRILAECASQTIQNSNSMFGIRGSVGYVAPGNSKYFTLNFIIFVPLLLTSRSDE